MTSATPQHGSVRINGMRLWGKHGANPGERDHAQPIDVDVEIIADLRPGATSDLLADTIDYACVYRICENIVTGESYSLLEALANKILQSICQDARVLEAVVRVRKPRFLEGATPEVELRHRR